MEGNIIFEIDHIMEKILGYVIKRNNAALVCKNFYKAVCEMEKFQYVVEVDVSLNIVTTYH